MENLLIIEDDIIQSHFMVNYICKEIPNIRLYNIATTGKEALNIINEKKVDIIILDLNLPDMTGIDILNYIDANNIQNFTSSIIIVTGEMELLRQVKNNKNIFTYCSKVNGYRTIINDIKKLLYEKQKNHNNDLVTEQIKNELQKLKFNFSYIGTKYLCDCIKECYDREDIYNINLKSDIYPILAKKYNKTINSIKSCIFKSILIMYYESSEQNLSEYFGYKIITKPKTKDIIFSVIQKIK